MKKKKKIEKKGVLTLFGLAPRRLGKCYRSLHGRGLDVFVCGILRYSSKQLNHE